MNHELYELYEYVEVARCVQIQRLRWLGHVVRVDGLKLMLQWGLVGGADHLRIEETSWNMTSILLVYLNGARLQVEGATSVFY